MHLHISLQIWRKARFIIVDFWLHKKICPSSPFVTFDLHCCFTAYLASLFLRQHSHQIIAKIYPLNAGGIGVGFILQAPTVFIEFGYLIKDQVSFPVLRFRMKSTTCKDDEPIQQGKLKIKKSEPLKRRPLDKVYERHTLTCYVWAA